MDIDFDIMEYYRKKEEKKGEFLNERKYLKTIDDILDKELDSEDYNEPPIWTNEIDMIFSFLYDYAYDITPFEEEIAIKYKDKYISLFEIHGQGCYRRIETLKDEPKEYVKFEDIIRLHETGEKPYRSQVLETVNKSLDILEAASIVLNLTEDNVNNDILDIESIKEYLKSNLN